MIRCIACKQQIPEAASVCSVCKSYQANWRNWLQYFSGIAALIALTFSAAAWVYLNAKQIVWYTDNVSIISANTLTSAVVANLGDGEVFVSHMLFTMPGRTSNWSAPRINFNERLPAGQFLKKDYPKPKLDVGAFVRGLSNEEFEKLIVRGVKSDPCVELVFFERQDATLRELTQMAGSTLNTFAVGGYLQFWGLGKVTPTLVPVTGTGVVRQCLL